MSDLSMDGSLIFLVPKVPPAKDGVGDYTYHLGKEVAKSHPVTIVTSQGQREERDGDRFRTLAVIPRWNALGMVRLFSLLKGLRPSFINVQWVPFLWGRWGINFSLPLAVLRLRQAGYRVVTTVHEPYVPFDTCSRIVMGLLQRLEFRLMVLGSAKVAVTTSRWTEMFQRLFPWKREDIFWLPVGSNIPKVPISSMERRELRRLLGLDDEGLLIAVFNPLTAGKMIDLLYRTWILIRQRQKNAKLLMLGCRLEEMPACWRENKRGVITTGYLDPRDASRFLSCADLCLSPFVDGVSARRTSVITAMEHSLPIVTTRGHLTDRELFDPSPIILVNKEDEERFVNACVGLVSDAKMRARLGEATVRFYQSHFSWPLIAGQLLERVLGSRLRSSE